MNNTVAGQRGLNGGVTMKQYLETKLVAVVDSA